MASYRLERRSPVLGGVGCTVVVGLKVYATASDVTRLRRRSPLLFRV